MVFSPVVYVCQTWFIWPEPNFMNRWTRKSCDDMIRIADTLSIRSNIVHLVYEIVTRYLTLPHLYGALLMLIWTIQIRRFGKRGTKIIRSNKWKKKCQPEKNIHADLISHQFFLFYQYFLYVFLWYFWPVNGWRINNLLNPTNDMCLFKNRSMQFSCLHWSLFVNFYHKSNR